LPQEPLIEHCPSIDALFNCDDEFQAFFPNVERSDFCSVAMTVQEGTLKRYD
jgi:hypothetical protein